MNREEFKRWIVIGKGIELANGRDREELGMHYFQGNRGRINKLQKR